MNRLLAYVEQGVAYLWGEQFALLLTADDVKSGWYIVEDNKNIFKDKKGTTRVRVSVVQAVDSTDVKALLNVYYGTTEGMHTIFSNKGYVPPKIRYDSRFITLTSLYETLDNFSMSTVTEDEMRNFIHKVGYSVATNMIREIMQRNSKDSDSDKDKTEVVDSNN